MRRRSGPEAMAGVARAIGLCVLLLVGLPPAASGRDAAAPLAGKWTATDPPINFARIETGEINRHGEAVGYHHRPNGIDPPGAKVLGIVQPPDASGVYRARVGAARPRLRRMDRQARRLDLFPRCDERE